MTKKNIIDVKNLSKIFRVQIKESGFFNKLRALFFPKHEDFIAVDNISFSVRSGEKIAFLGPNGAGKSTTIKMLTGILSHTSGEISVCGLNPSSQRNKLTYKIGAVFGQTSKLWYHLTPLDTFKLMGEIFEVDHKILRKRIDYLVEKFDIKSFMGKPVRKLSLGQRMRCEIVATLINQPEVLFLDEPTIGLDMIAKQKLREIINEINEKENTTIFLTSHDIGDIEKVCERVVIINHGKIVYDGSIEDLRKNHVKETTVVVHQGPSIEEIIKDFY